MKKSILFFVMVILLVMSSVAFANLSDTKTSIAQTYGDYRMVIDTDNQPWTKAEWELKGYQKAKAASYVYYFSRNDVGMQMEVQYENDKAGAYAILQRFTPNSAIKLKELRNYFPEISSLIDSPRGEYFTSYNEVTRNFQEQASPVTLGLVINSPVAPQRDKYYTVIAFNIQDEGRYVKDPKYISGDTFVREIVIQRVLRSEVAEKLDTEWTRVKKFF